MSNVGTEDLSYGITERRSAETLLDRAAEEISTLGFSVVDGGYTPDEVLRFRERFESVHAGYIAQYGLERLRAIDEHNGIRLPLVMDDAFLALALNERVLGLVRKLVRNAFILNQQNGIVNPPAAQYNQGAWHRDLPYQHFVSSRPLAVNALYCVDDFTADNGATWVIPGSQHHEEFPSDAFVAQHGRQLAAPAGSFLVMHAMAFHRGGANRTTTPRRGVNHVYTTAFIKQQIDIPACLGGVAPVREGAADLLGFRYRIPRSIEEYLLSRVRPTTTAPNREEG